MFVSLEIYACMYTIYLIETSKENICIEYRLCMQPFQIPVYYTYQFPLLTISLGDFSSIFFLFLRKRACSLSFRFFTILVFFMNTQKERSLRETMKKFFAPVKKFSWLYVAVLASGLFKWVLLILFTDIIKRVVEDIQAEQYEYIMIYVSVFAWLFLLSMINTYIYSQHTLNKLWPVLRANVLETYMKKFFQLDMNYGENVWTGKFINVIERWADAWFMLLVDTAWVRVIQLGRMLFSIVYIFSINSVYGIVSWIIVSLTLFVIVRQQNQANRGRKKRKEVNIQQSRTLVRHIQSKSAVLQAGMIGEESATYIWYGDTITAHNKFIMWYNGLGQLFSRFLFDALKISVILVTVYGYFWQYISLSEFVSLMMILGLVDGSMRQVTRMYVDFCRQFVHIEKLRDLFDHAPESTPYDEGIDVSVTQWDIHLEDVDFGYETSPDPSSRGEQHSIFKNFSLNITGWTKTALVWPSGSWKSTLVKLIAGYLRPDGGAVLVDGQDLTQVSLQSYYAHVWYLTQEPSVFDGTVWENLTYGTSPNPSLWEGNSLASDRVHEAIRHARCEFVYDLPEGRDTEIGERGVRLSWWQRQRLAIAKIFLKNPEIVILDEPTSALDSESEEAITQAMNDLFENRTVIIIAHRLQTVKNADRIVLIEDGEVKEDGTHVELMWREGSYFKMVELQSGF